MLRRLTRRSLLAGSAAAAFCRELSAPVELFRSGQNGVHTYRIPALIETRQGTLIAVADARFESSRDLPARIALLMRRSRDSGKTWSPVETLRSVSQGGVGDASLLLDQRSGRIWCFHAYGPPGVGFLTSQAGALTGPATLQVHSIHSDDGGESWSRPADLTPQIKRPEWMAMFATSGTHFETSRGRYLIPMVVRDENKQIAARNAYSDDRGSTWKIGPAIGTGTDESKAVEWAKGQVVQNLRNGNRRAVARSMDGGISFGEVSHDETLIDPGCNAGFARIGKTLIFTNAASASRRENLTARWSIDGGITWAGSVTIHEGPAGYSTVVPLGDGSGGAGVLFECGESSPSERIAFVRLRLPAV